jgi:hypothetical protein
MRRRIGRFLGVALLVLLAGGASAEDTATALLDPYFRIHARLADDSVEGVRADAKLIATHAQTMGEGGKPITDAATALGRSSDLDGAREAFGRLSDALIEWAEHADFEATVMYCPMADKSWLQKGDAVKNPYFGSAMLNCGEKKKKAKS